jgi:hypothetical protein
MSILEKDGYIVDLGTEDFDSGSPDLAMVQAIQYTSGANRTSGNTHTVTWPKSYTRYEVKFSEITASQSASFKYLFETLMVGYKNTCNYTDDDGNTLIIRIDGTPDVKHLGKRVLPDGIGLVNTYSLSFWRETYIP